VLHYLLLAGAHASGSDVPDGMTPLHCAAAGGSAHSGEVCRALLQFGACPDAMDALGRRPLDLLPPHTVAPTAALLHRASSGSSSDGGALERLLGAAPHVPSVHHLPLGGPSSLEGATPADWASDDFQMYEFKVRRCTKTRAHDWTECPFTHPGEKARRRDPRVFGYSGTACPDFRKGACRRGDACEWAHGVFECWLHPSRYRTNTCKDGPACTRRVCFFAHLPGELRAPTMTGPLGQMPPGLGGMDGSAVSGSLPIPTASAGAPPNTCAGGRGGSDTQSASPERHPLPHSSSDSSNDSGAGGSPPRSASPPQQLAPFGELLPAAVGLHSGQQAAWAQRRAASLDGGPRPLPGGGPMATVSSAHLEAERQLAHLHLSAGPAHSHSRGLDHHMAAAVAAHAAAAAAAAAVHQQQQQLQQSQAEASAMLAQQHALHRAAAQQRAMTAALANHNAQLQMQHQVEGLAYGAMLGAPAQLYRAAPVPGPASQAVSFPRPSSFAHLGIVEDVLGDADFGHRGQEQMVVWA
jgi:hypothetical protein